MRLIIVRHGHRDDDANPKQYSSNRNNNCPLSKRGMRQVNLKWLSYFDENIYSIDTVYVSPFLRTIQTANIIIETYDTYFNEKPKKIIDYNFCEGQNISEPCFSNSFIEELKKNGVKMNENLKDIKQRIKISLDNIIKTHDEHSIVMIVTHGIVCGLILDILLKDIDFTIIIKIK